MSFSQITCFDTKQRRVLMSKKLQYSDRLLQFFDNENSERVLKSSILPPNLLKMGHFCPKFCS